MDANEGSNPTVIKYRRVKRFAPVLVVLHLVISAVTSLVKIFSYHSYTRKLSNKKLQF